MVFFVIKGHGVRWFVPLGALCACWCAWFVPVAQAQVQLDEFTLRQWTTADGLPQNSVNDLVQDAQGYLWLATFGGLVRFNGTHFQVFDETTPGLESNRFLSLLVDNKQRLWIGTEDDGVFFWENDRFQACGPEQGCPLGQIIDIDTTPDGSLWFLNRKGLYRRYQGRLEQVHRHDVELERLRRLIPSPQGDLWAHGWGSIWRWRQGEWSQVASPPPEERFSYIAWDGDGLLVLGTQQLWRLKRGQLLPQVLPDAPQRDKYHMFTQFLQVDPKGLRWLSRGESLWLGAQGAGWRRALNIRELAHGNHWDFPEVRVVMQDREGSYWVGTNRHGLIAMRQRNLVRFLDRENLVGFSLTGDGQDGIWAGVGCNQLVRLGDSGLLESHSLHGHLGGCISSLLPLGPRRMLVGMHRFLFLWEDGQVRPLMGPFDNANVNVLYRDPRGQIWVGVHGFGLYRLGEALTPEPALPGPQSQTTRSLAMDGRGRLWVGSDHGLAMHDGQRWAQLPPGGPTGSIRALYLEDNGVVWVGSYGGGLGRLQDGAWTLYTTQQGLHENVISHISLDQEGHFWLHGNRGLSRVKKADMERLALGQMREIQASLYASGEGNGGVQPSGHMDGLGRLWVPTIFGIARVDTTQGVQAVPPPLASIERILVDGRPLAQAPGHSYELPLGKRSFAVEVAGLTFLEPRQALMRYRLRGVQEEWSVPSRQRMAIWTSVPPGTYTLELEARNIHGQWSQQPAIATLVIPFYFYETWWFRWSLLFVLLLTGYALHLWRLGRLEQRRLLLQTQEEERREVQERLLHGRRLATLGRLAGGIAHDFNNLLTAMRGSIQLQALMFRDQDHQGAQQQIEMLEACTERAAALTGKLLAFGGRPRLRLSTVDLRQLVRDMDPMMRRLLNARASLELDLAEDPVWVRVDAGQMDQILINLCLHANETLVEPHRLVVRVQRLNQEEHLWGRLAFILEKTSLSPQELQSRLTPVQHPEKHDGQQLELWTLPAVVQSFDGRFQARVSQGQAHFEVWAVSERGPTPVPFALPPREETPSPKDQRIFLCDDDTDVLRTVKRALKRQRYQVVAFEDPLACLEALRASPQAPALLISDVLMPQMHGPELVKLVRQRFPGLPVLYLSGYLKDEGVTPDDKTHFLQKPFALDALEAAVQALMHQEPRLPER